MSNSTPSPTQFVDLDNARVEEQRQVMTEIIKAGHCPFCAENLEKYHHQPWMKEGTYWLVTTNSWPYENTRNHLLLIYKPHAVRLAELDPAAGQELFVILAELEEELSIPGGGVSIRFGDTNYSAGSVNHLHAQLIVPDITRPGFKPVRVKLGKDQAPV